MASALVRPFFSKVRLPSVSAAFLFPRTRRGWRLLLAAAVLAEFPWQVSAKEFVFVAYNLANYGPLPEPGRKKPAKSARSTEAVIRVLKSLEPDVIGVCEMGSPKQFDDFRRRLSEAGLHYPEAEYLEGADPDRRLALVSRIPIVARNSQPDLSFDADGSHEKVRRGLLDVTLRTESGFRLRFVGLHLKSKLPIREGETLIRRHESHLVRQHVEAIMAAEPELPLLVYGDFNDTKESIGVRAISGTRGSPMALTALPLADDLGDRWTHHWSATDIYSRIDFILVNRAASRAVVRERSSIARVAEWARASDHRPLVVHFRALTPERLSSLP
ncbi:MAG TPA: endonuclease/exonuclease/phosphatase family protein [Chthoniobacteraceae bacterium]|nr:endonuclease/exonuclease/phosphatase family protein [Chthoniobacteraceae bacterium]